MVKEGLLNYLKEQRAERVEKIEAFNAAFVELNAAQEKVARFGDMSGVIAEAEKLEEFIHEIEEENAVVNSEENCQCVSEEQQEEGVADGIEADTEAEA